MGYFEELIKDEPDVNIENEDGEWVDLKDVGGRRYLVSVSRQSMN